MNPMATNGGMASPFFPANFLLQMQQPLPHNHHHHHHHHPGQQQHELHHLLPPPPPSLSPFLQDMGGVAPPMAPMQLASAAGGVKRMYDDDDDAHEQDGARHEASEDEEGNAAGGGGEKKRRLGVEQVRTLEKNFELGNKLEPERKAQLARALGLQPRQVAIWFQNRRARWKTKQLEKDYEVLHRQLNAARDDNDALLSLNNKLQAEIVALKGGGGGGSGGSSRQQEAASELINLNVRETAPEASCSNNRSENSSEINLDISRPDHRAGAAGAAIPFYASVGSATAAGVDIDQLLHTHSPSTAVAPQPKMELGIGTGSFGSMLCGAVDEPPPFWPWADGGHHHFH